MEPDEIKEKVKQLYTSIDDFEKNNKIGPQSLRDHILEGMLDQINELEEKLKE